MQPCTEESHRTTVFQKRFTFLTAERMQSPVSCMLQTIFLSMFPDSFINCRAWVPWNMQLPSQFSNQTKSHCPAQVASHLNQLSCWIWEIFIAQTHVHQRLKHIKARMAQIIFKLYFLRAACMPYTTCTSHLKLVSNATRSWLLTTVGYSIVCFVL